MLILPPLPTAGIHPALLSFLFLKQEQDATLEQIQFSLRVTNEELLIGMFVTNLVCDPCGLRMLK